MKCAIYIRSSKENNNSNAIVQNQISFFENYIKEFGLELTNIYSDTGSGSTLDRPALQKLMQDAKNHQFDAVLVTDLSRISRKALLTQQFIEHLEANNVQLITLDIKKKYNRSDLESFFIDTNNKDVVDYPNIQNKRCAIYIHSSNDLIKFEKVFCTHAKQLIDFDFLKFDMFSLYRYMATSPTFLFILLLLYWVLLTKPLIIF